MDEVLKFAEETPLAELKAFDQRVHISKLPRSYREDDPHIVERQRAVDLTHRLVRGLAEIWVEMQSCEESELALSEVRALDYTPASLCAIDRRFAQQPLLRRWKKGFLREHLVPGLACYTWETLDRSLPGNWAWEYGSRVSEHGMRCHVDGPLLLPFDYAHGAIFSGYRLEEFHKALRFHSLNRTAESLYLVPRDPLFVPVEERRQKARALFKAYAPEGGEAEDNIARSTGFVGVDRVHFVSAGYLLTHVTCPACGSRQRDSSWRSRLYGAPIDIAAGIEAATLEAPCCERRVRVDRIECDRESAFARFLLEHRRTLCMSDYDDPMVGPTIAPEAVGAIGEALGCELRVIVSRWL